MRMSLTIILGSLLLDISLIGCTGTRSGTETAAICKNGHLSTRQCLEYQYKRWTGNEWSWEGWETPPQGATCDEMKADIEKREALMRQLQDEWASMGVIVDYWELPSVDELENSLRLTRCEKMKYILRSMTAPIAGLFSSRQ